MDDRAPSSRDRTRLIVAAVIGLPGAIFLLQGLGAPIGRSFMIGDPTWAWIGGAMLVIALGIAAGPSLGRRRRR